MTFIEIVDLGGTVHSINTAHIIEVSQFEKNETNIILSNGNVIYTSLSKFDVVKKATGLNI
ncbi:hypothetical protein ACGK9U_01480 [Mariniflexile sp. HNIBRBA6329]|uniref:hypothetical protein n=1 Tax=Mariniflexile sp. HNIBRBA6329 TaxID=3373088 RepID=UPI003746DD5E